MKMTGENFARLVELKRILLAHMDEFARDVTARMFGCALNRGLESYDVPIVRRAAKALAASNDRVETVVMEIVKSYPSQYRRGSNPLAAQP